MDFQTYCNEAREWTEKISKTQLQLLDSIENENKLIFIAGNVSFYVVCPTSKKPDWVVWSDMAPVLSHLKGLKQLFKSCPQKTLTNVLDIVEDTLTPLLQAGGDSEAEEDDDDDDDDDTFGDYVEQDEDLDILSKQTALTSGGGDPMSVHRLLKDLKVVKSNEGKFGFKAQPRDDNLFLWDVQLIDFPADTDLGRDLQEYAKKYNREPVIHMEMKFPEDYPMAPPFVRVIRPTFKFLTGHVTIGGSICMELLTRTGWKPTNDIEGILVQIRAEIMSDTKARLGKHPDKEYEESAARNAFKRMEKTYGWDK
ncbi:hypothetical protein NP493_18g08012 [Ridgeia piscesae]|uniref:UBC core domain-containing protein n=1 Tax=Ridgeia piscesae TaxID=27915 RepID=A0AAD9PDV3_RIDPI|nr:hypothetical protein NP493_18g08012 [Ridgeia piscesae]